VPEQNTHPANNEMTVIGPDTRISGEMTFDKSARILGAFEGKIIAQGEVQIGPSADCRAAIDAKRVVVDGAVTGPIHARERLTLSPNARVTGDITAGTLIVAEGASFVGQCQVGPQAAELSKNLGSTMPAGEIDFKPPWKHEAATSAA
jgi:cytoskeletal protein CcmA (bactofilin family)